jgi:hypothetical protein
MGTHHRSNDLARPLGCGCHLIRLPLPPHSGCRARQSSNEPPQRDPNHNSCRHHEDDTRDEASREKVVSRPREDASREKVVSRPREDASREKVVPRPREDASREKDARQGQERMRQERRMHSQLRRSVSYSSAMEPSSSFFIPGRQILIFVFEMRARRLWRQSHRVMGRSITLGVDICGAVLETDDERGHDDGRRCHAHSSLKSAPRLQASMVPVDSYR